MCAKGCAPGCYLSCRLRREYQIGGGVPVLLSTEKPRCQLVSMVDLEGANPLDYQVGSSGSQACTAGRQLKLWQPSPMHTCAAIKDQ